MKRRRQIWLWLLALGAVCAVSLGVWLRRDRAAAIAGRTAWALEQGNAAALLALASPYERDALGLTAHQVRSLLMHSLGRGGYPKRLKVVAERSASANERQFAICSGEPDAGWERDMHIMIAKQKPGDDWHLMLTATIIETIAVRPEPSSRGGQWQQYERIARELGVPGRVGVGYNLVKW